MRYAVFHTPAPGPLAQFTAAWLGWDPVAGHEVAHPDLPGIDVAALTRSARRYGFHATLKAPFHLAQGRSQTELRTALRAIAARSAPVALSRLELTQEFGFVALRPPANDPALSALGALETALVTGLDPFRAPLNETELARRRRAPLTPRQEEYLTEHGYPYVREEFRMHFTLTGRISPDDGTALIDRLRPLIRPLLAEPYVIDSLTLLQQDAAGRFHQHQRYPLSG